MIGLLNLKIVTLGATIDTDTVLSNGFDFDLNPHAAVQGIPQTILDQDFL